MPRTSWPWPALLLAAAGLAPARADEPRPPAVVECPGRVEAARTVQLRPRASGLLAKVAVRDGAAVTAGQVLFEIDPRPYQAEADRAAAEVRRAEAALHRAAADADRLRRLKDTRAVSEEEVARSAAARNEAEAVLQGTRAALDLARLRLEATRVTAPVSGRIGRCLVDPDNLVKADDTVLAVLTADGPPRVVFFLDELTALRLRRQGATPPLPVAVGLADEQGYPHQGRVEFIDTALDPANGTLRLGAVVPDERRLFLPGLSARVRLHLPQPAP